MNASYSGIFRNVLFWLHLAAGLIAGAILLSMACSGMLMAFAPQLTAWAERGVSRATAAPETPALRPDSLFAAAAAAFPGARIESMTFNADPDAAIQVGFPKGQGGAFLDPRSGAVLGKTSRLREYFLTVEHWHRWMGEAKRGEFLTHAAALALIFMVLSGWCLWIPRRKGPQALKSALALDWKLKGRAGERNMHMTFGFWSGAFLLIIGLTGSIMGYRWAEGLLYSVAGNGDAAERGADRKPGRQPGQQRNREAAAESDAGSGFNAKAIDSLMSGASDRVPRWRTITMRLPRTDGAPVNAMIEEPGWLGFSQRSRLAADPVSGTLMKWEPYAKQSAGKKWRSWMVPLHTGRGFGIVGQCAAALAAFSLALLVWTGLSLGIRTLAARLKSRRGIPSQAILEPGPRQMAGHQRNGYRPWKRK